jgi:hypothetical protein
MVWVNYYWIRISGDLAVKNLARSGDRRERRTKTYLHEIKELKRSNSSEELERLLLGLIDPVEAQERIDGYGLAYYYTEQMAILYRKKGNI